MIQKIDDELQGNIVELSRQMLELLKDSGIKDMGMFTLGIGPSTDYINFHMVSGDCSHDRVYVLNYSQWKREDGTFIVNAKGVE